MSTTPPPQPPIEDFELRMPDDLDVEHCYRHPDRETGVRCANCGRPICHDCMTPAAVGFRCPECMAEQRRSAGRGRVVTRQQTRGRWQAGGVMMGSSRLTVTKVLIAINVVMFLIELALGATTNGRELLRLGGLVPVYVFVQHEYWRMVTVMFLHASLWHILFNMWALWVLGDYVEALLGHLKFLVLYLVAGIGGSVVVLLAGPAYTITVGASGAIFGIFGALSVYAFLFRNRDFAARALLGNMVFLLIINLVFTFANPTVSWQGHIGGLLTGGVLMAGYTAFGRRGPASRFTANDLVVTLVVLAVLGALTFWKVQSFSMTALLPWL